MKACTFERKDEIVPLIEKEIINLTTPALKDELAKRNLSKKGNKQSVRQKTNAVQTDTLLLCTARDETNNFPKNCPCFPLLLDLQNEVKEIKANSLRQIQPNLTSNCELTKLQEENNALKRRLCDVEDHYDSIQDKNESLMTALRLLNKEIGKDKY